LAKTKLDIAFWYYDRTAPLRDGDVAIADVDATYYRGRIVTDVFKAMVKHRTYDLFDLGISYLARTMNFDEPPFLATTSRPRTLSQRRSTRVSGPAPSSDPVPSCDQAMLCLRALIWSWP
jgi:4,5-dihydroxyphthalate decarboxylase